MHLKSILISCVNLILQIYYLVKVIILKCMILPLKIMIVSDYLKIILKILIDYEEEKYIFLSGGKDKTLRLWDHEMNVPIKYYEGHHSTVN